MNTTIFAVFLCITNADGDVGHCKRADWDISYTLENCRSAAEWLQKWRDPGQPGDMSRRGERYIYKCAERETSVWNLTDH